MSSWLPWSSAKKAAEPENKVVEAPDRISRAKCWDSRDRFFLCLDKHDILDALKDEDKATKACPSENQKYEENCASSWVKYFKQRRVAEYDKEQLLKRQQEEMFNKK
ncbi:hypothetical protein BT63DRAFT_375660 [Microthyrium microscopicum]|uniref:Cytochrome c oxidase, subunit VIb n=1 Tax=Microthyrium microscopicum TaxID=703497 RepID=A0A6A6U8I5_9PEZI|nr:hypothetical protein BT63DRAFT_375660 [Microthyrium microscopicum]